MSCARVVLLCSLLFALPAHAGTVGVVVTGDADLQQTLSKQLEAYLRSHGHRVGDALPAEAINILLNCMVMDDQSCARGVVEKQAKTESVLFGQVAKSRTSNATIITVYLISKGKEPIGMRRACEECSDDLLRSTVDEVLGIILKTSSLERGRLSLHSKPEGMTVVLDNENIGVTPLEREVPAGPHTVVLMRRGQKVGERTLKIHADVTAEITIPVTVPEDPPGTTVITNSKAFAGVTLGIGGAAIVAGAVLFLTSEKDTGEKLFYRETRPLGIGLAAGGAAVAGIGLWLWLRGGESEDSAPVASISNTGGQVGWTRAF